MEQSARKASEGELRAELKELTSKIAFDLSALDASCAKELLRPVPAA